MAKPKFFDPNVIVAELLREARQAAGLTQVELAHKLRQTQSRVSKIERGEVRLDLGQLRQMCGLLDMPLSRLVARFERRLRRRRKR